MQPINKHTVLKEVRDTGSWDGYLLPSKANPHSPWINPQLITIKRTDERPRQYYVDLGYDSVILEDYLASYAYYNCNAELGRRIRFWEEYTK